MTTLGDRLRAAAHAHAVTARVSDAAASSIGTAAQRRRRRRVVTVAGSSAAVVIVAGGATWALQPEPPIPAMHVADGVVAADVPPIPSALEQTWCLGAQPEPYVPWAEEGVSIRSEEVSESGLEVTATPFMYEADQDNDIAAVSGEAIVLDDPPAATGPGDYAGVQFEISWPGNALYDVSAFAFLVSQERVLTPIDSLEYRVIGDNAEPEWAPSTYDPATDSTSAVYSTLLDPTACTYASGESAIPFDQAAVHTLVQVRDEQGVPLATWVDANGIDGTTVEYARDQTTDPTPAPSFAPVTEEERARILATRADYDPVPSGEALLRDRIADDGVPLVEIERGLARQHSCPAVGSTPLTEPVLPVTDYALATASRLFPPLPDTVPISTLRDGGVVEIEEGSPQPGLGLDATIALLDSEGAVAGMAGAFFTGRGYAGGWEFFPAGGCHDVTALEAGREYTAVALSHVRDERWVPVDLPQPAVWDAEVREVMGTVTLTEDANDE